MVLNGHLMFVGTSLEEKPHHARLKGGSIFRETDTDKTFVYRYRKWRQVEHKTG